MTTQKLLSEIIDKDENAPVMVIFGGNPFRRDEVLQLIQSISGITVYGVLSEEEGLQQLKTLPKVDLILIGGRYTDEQRVRIRKYVNAHLPNAKTTEPGYDYPYQNAAIAADIKQKLRTK